MKFIKKQFIIIITIVLLVSAFQKIEAISRHGLSLDLVDHDITANGYKGSGTKKIADGSTVQEGQIIQLDSSYSSVGPVGPLDITVNIEFDPLLVELIYDAPALKYVTMDPIKLDKYLIYPKGGRADETSWKILDPKVTKSTVKVALEAGDNDIRIEQTGKLFSVFFRVKDNITPGTPIHFTHYVDQSGESTSIGANGNTTNIDFKSAFVKVAGETVVENNKVTNITAKGSTGVETYDYLKDVFNPSQADKTPFEIVVPNSVKDITFDGVLDPLAKGTTLKHGRVDAVGNVISGGLALSVGDNYFMTTVSNSAQEVVKQYRYTIRRLSNATNIKVLATDDNGQAILFVPPNTGVVLGSASFVDLSYIKPSTETQVEVSSSTTDVSGDRVTILKKLNDPLFTVFDVKVTPEDAQEKFSTTVQGINDVKETEFNRGVAVVQEYTLERKSSDNALTSIEVKNSDGLKEQLKLWETSQDEYRLDVSDKITKIDLIVIPKDNATTIFTPDSQLKGIKLNFNENIIEVEVRAPDGTPKMYKVIINRVARKITDLQSLSVKTGIPELNDSVLAPTKITNITIPYQKDAKVTILAQPKLDSGASVVPGNEVPILLAVGLNSFKVEVKAEDKTVSSIYTVNLTMKKNPNASIEGGILPDTSKGDDWLQDPSNPVVGDSVGVVDPLDETVTIYRYAMDVLNKKKNFGMNDLKYLNPEGATISGGENIDLVVGENTFTFDLVSQDTKSISRYIFTINRAKNTVPKADDIIITSVPQGIRTGTLETGLTYKVDSAVEYTIEAILSDGSFAQADTVGVFELRENKTHTVIIISEDGLTTKNYTIKIERTKSKDFTLSEIVISHKDQVEINILPLFANQSLEYEVDKDVESIKIVPKTTHSNAHYLINGLSDLDFDLKPGLNNFSIVVSSESNIPTNYVFNVTRKKNNVALLDALYVDKVLVPTWNQENEQYTVTAVDEQTETLDITYLLSDLNSKIEFDNKLKHGDNSINIKVTAEDGVTTKTYVINVFRALSSSVDLGPGSIKPGLDNKNDTISSLPGDPYRYKVFVPSSTKTYTKDSFILDLSNGATVVYEKESIDLKKTPSLGENEFKFTLTSPNGEHQQVYIIEVHMMDSATPELVSISIDGVNYVSFDPMQMKPVINLDGLIEENASEFIFTVIAQEGVDVSPNTVYNLKVKGKKTIVQSVTLTKVVGGLTSTYSFEFTRTLSSDNKMDNIALDGAEMLPVFDSNSSGPYGVTVPHNQSSINISGEAINPNATVTGIGNLDLVPGENKVTVSVTPEDKSVAKHYEIVVSRGIELNDLKIADRVIDLSSAVRLGQNLTITVNEPFGSDLVSASVIANGNHASVSVSGQANKEVVLDNTEMKFVLTAKDGKTKLNVTVIYARTLSDDARLLTLDIKIPESKLSPVFSSDQDVYDLEVRHDFETIIRDSHFSWTPVHINTKVDSIEKVDMPLIGVLVYKITGRSESGSEFVYTLNVKKAAYNFLEDLKISIGDGHLDKPFQKENFDYQATILTGKKTFSFDWVSNLGVTVINEAELKNISTSVLPKNFEIKVKGDTDVVNTYKIYVNIGMSTRLASMESSLGKLEFKPDNEIYEVLVPQDAKTVSLINVVAEDANAIVSGNYANIQLNGVETGPVKIIVKNGSQEKVYKVSFKKVADQTGISKIIASLDGNLWESKLNESGKLEITLNPDTVLKDVNLDVVLGVMGGKVEVSVGILNDKKELEYVVSVTDSNGINKKYDLVLKNDLSDNNYLEMLTVMNEKVLGFDRFRESYDYTWTTGEAFTISGIPEDPSASVSYNIPSPLVSGSNVEVTVLSTKGNSRVYTVKVVIQKENIATLESLSITEADFSPNFSSVKSDYYMTIPNELDKLTVNFKAQGNGTASLSSNGTVTGNVVSNLIVGDNSIKVLVKAENGTEYTYTIHIKREEKSNNFLTDLSIYGIEGNQKLNLSPLFTSEKYVYEVTVPRGKSNFNVVGVHDPMLTAHGLGEVSIFEFPFTHEVKVVDSKNISRSYYIKFVQEASGITTLANIWTDKGSLDPVFSSTKYAYNIDVPYETKNITIFATATEEDQIVEGKGLKLLKPGRNTYQITVGSGKESQIYTINVNRSFLMNAELDWLNVSVGELLPTFDKKDRVYRVRVENEINELEISAGSSSDNVVIEGVGLKTLLEGQNIFEIKVDAGAGVKDSYFVIVDRGIEESLELAYLGIRNELLNENFDSKVMTYTADLSKSYYENLELIAIPKNPNAKVEIIGNTSVGIGQTLVTVKVSTSDIDFLETTVLVNVMNQILESEIHVIGENYIDTLKPELTVIDVKNQMLNDNTHLQIYVDGVLLSDSDSVGTGAIIKLVIDGKEYDHKTLIIKGDVNGDGSINIPDILMVVSYILENTLTDVQMIAAEVNDDSMITVADLLKIQSHILGIVDIHQAQGGDN